MKSPLSPRLAAGLPTLLLWALVAGSAAWWWLRAGELAAPLQAPVAGAALAAPTLDSAQVARALGATPAAPVAAAPAPELAGRLALRGIVTHQGRGAALIAVDGKPAKPLRVGAVLPGVEGGWRLRSLTPHAALLVADGRELRLEMPALAQRSSAGDAVAPLRPGLAAPPMQPMAPMQPAGAMPPLVPSPVMPPAPLAGQAAPAGTVPPPQAFVPPASPRND